MQGGVADVCTQGVSILWEDWVSRLISRQVFYNNNMRF
jgi:hypothetical protein